MRLPDAPLELLERQRPVVERRGEAEAVLDEVRLARAVAVGHRPQLRERDVALVDHEQEVLREVVEQRRRRLPGRAAREVARVVLDPRAEADLADHLQVEARALLQALGLEQLLLAAQPGQPLRELGLDRGERALDLLLGDDVVAAGPDRDRLERAGDRAGQRVDPRDALDLVAEELDAHRRVALVGGEDLDDVAADAEGAAVEVQVVALVLDVDQLAQQPSRAVLLPDRERHAQPA